MLGWLLLGFATYDSYYGHSCLSLRRTNEQIRQESKLMLQMIKEANGDEEKIKNITAGFRPMTLFG